MPSHLGGHASVSGADDRKVEEDDIDRLLESALSDMKLCQASTGDAQDLPRDSYELTKLIEEFKRTADTSATPSSSDMPEKIDAAIEKLLNMTNVENPGNDAEPNFEEIDSMIEQLMSDLTNRELLAEPFAELAKAYPRWIEENSQDVDEEQLRAYKEQCKVISQINGLLSSPSFDKERQSNQKAIFDLMQRMQELGSPPEAMLKSIGMGCEIPQQPPDCLQM